MTTAILHDDTSARGQGNLLMMGGALIVEKQIHTQTVQQYNENYV